MEAKNWLIFVEFFERSNTQWTMSDHLIYATNDEYAGDEDGDGEIGKFN